MLKYLKENLGAPSIIGFIFLLTLSAAYLSLGNEALANTLAEYGYYCLVIGVILQIVSLKISG